jgi:hypothetical protein
MAEHLNPDPEAQAHALDVAALAIPGGVRPVVWLAPSAGDALSPRLARRLLHEYTHHGDLIVDVDDDVALAAAAAETGRRHHALGGTHRLAALGDAAGYVDLVLLRWPRPEATNPRWLLTACRTLLRSDSTVLVVAVSVPAQHRIAHLTALTGAALAVGLRYLHHVAIVDPAADHAARSDIDCDGTSSRSGHTTGHAAAGRHTVAPHTDLLIFTSEDVRHD